MEEHEKRDAKKHILIRIAVCTVILLIGWVGMKGLASLKTPPTEAKPEEKALKVKAIVTQPGNYEVTITGYGEARPVTEVTISPEVSGKVVHTHPKLKVGRIISAGEVLFSIDPANYEAGQQEARAMVAQWQSTVARLKKQWEIDTQRMKTLIRSAELARIEFDRVKRLFEKSRVGTQSGVDQAERTYNSVSDQADQMKQAVSLYPHRIKEAESNLLSAQARLSVAQANLSRCTVTAPFDARIKSVSVENEQYVSPGQPLLTLADDSLLEIQVPLDSRDARQWLQFKSLPARDLSIAWFPHLTPVKCTIRWTEDKAGTAWTGTLNRVVAFDERTRTLKVAIRVTAEDATKGQGASLPLVESMFCMVEIPGRTLKGVHRLPRQAVSFTNKAHLVDADRRLKTVDVEVVRIEDEYAYVSSGLSPGDTVVLTRLVDPLENTLLEVVDDESDVEKRS